MASRESGKDIFKGQWFTTMHSEGKVVTGPMIILKHESFYTHSFGGWLQNL